MPQRKTGDIFIMVAETKSHAVMPFVVAVGQQYHKWSPV